MTGPRLAVPQSALHALARGGTTTAQARPHGLIFYPRQARSFLTRTLTHPGLTTERMTTGDAATPRHLMPMYRRSDLDRPAPSGPAFRWEDAAHTMPVLDQTLPPIPTPDEIAGNGWLSGYDGVNQPDQPWSAQDILGYLSRHSNPTSRDREAGWECRKCRTLVGARHPEEPPQFRAEEILAHKAARHTVGPTILTDPNDAQWFKGGGRLIEWVGEFADGALSHGIDIGGDDLTDDDENQDGYPDDEQNLAQNIPDEYRRRNRRGETTSAFRAGDTMPAWARVVQMIQVLDRYAAAGGPLLRFTAICCHGWTDGLQLGLTMNPADAAYPYSKLFLRKLARLCHSEFSLIIYGCCTAGPGETFGHYSLANWVRHQLKRFGVASPRVDGHTVTADAFKTPWVRRFENGHDAGRWIVQPAFRTRAGEARPYYSYERQLSTEGASRGMNASQRIQRARPLARDAKNQARRHGRSNGPEPRFTAEQVASVTELWDRAQSYFNSRAVTADEAADALEGCFERYQYLIHSLPFAEEGSDASETAGAEGAYMADIPPPSDPPPRDPLDYRRWAKWERCVRHAIDFMTFEFPLLTTEQIHAYLDALPDLPGQGESGPTFSARLRAVANPDDPTTLHAWLFTPDGRAPLGSYFGTVPGSVREP